MIIQNPIAKIQGSKTELQFNSESLYISNYIYSMSRNDMLTKDG